MTPAPGEILDRMVLAVQRVRNRLLRAAAAMESADIPYAVAGGNAVAAWIATVDPAAVRTTKDIEILINPGDLHRVRRALVSTGFSSPNDGRTTVFLDGADARPWESVRVLLAGHGVQGNDPTSAPRVEECDRPDPQFRALKVEPLVWMELTAFRAKHAMHLRDMLDVGLVDGSWIRRFPPALATRLQHLIDTPEG